MEHYTGAAADKSECGAAAITTRYLTFSHLAHCTLGMLEDRLNINVIFKSIYFSWKLELIMQLPQHNVVCSLNEPVIILKFSMEIRDD